MKASWLIAPMLALALSGATDRAARAEADQSSQDLCAVPDDLMDERSPLLFASAVLKHDRKLVIVAVGSASTLGVGNTSPAAAWPARLRAALAKELPEREVTVHTVAARGMTAENAVRSLDKQVLPLKPSLVVWQAGTTEAARRVDPEEFGRWLQDGVDTLLAARIDVVLMDMQFSPRFIAAINYQPYLDAIVQVEQHRDLVRFQRFEVMRHWSETEQLAQGLPPDKPAALADRVHDCIGKLLGRMIGEALRQ